MEINISIVIASVVNILILGGAIILILKLVKSIAEMKKRNEEIEMLLNRVTEIIEKNSDQ
jgi:large-conductance mechanosensitive channel